MNIIRNKSLLNITPKLHHFRTSKIILYGSNFFRWEDDFPFFWFLCSLCKSQIKFLKTLDWKVSSTRDRETDPSRSLSDMLLGKLKSVDNLLGCDIVLEIELSQQLFDLELWSVNLTKKWIFPKYWEQLVVNVLQKLREGFSLNILKVS